MSLSQLVSNIVYTLGPASRTPFVWPDPSPTGSGLYEAVLGRVFAGRLPPNFSTRDAAAPFAVVVPGQTTPNPEHPEAYLDEVVVNVALVARNENDQGPMAAMVGANRLGQGSSVGKGVLDIEASVLARFAATTNQANGIALGARPHGTAVPAVEIPDDMKNSVAARAIEVTTSHVQTQPYFAPVRRLLATGGSGNVTLTWQPPPDTYDLVGILVVRASGSTAPPTPTTAGSTQVATVGPGATGYADAPGSGTWSYSIFGVYDTTRDPMTGAVGPGVLPDRYSGYVYATAAAPPSFVFTPASATVSV